MRLLEGAGALHPAARILGAEQLGLDPLRRHGGGRTDHEGRLRAVRAGVEHPGGQLLAGPRWRR